MQVSTRIFVSSLSSVPLLENLFLAKLFLSTFQPYCLSWIRKHEIYEGRLPKVHSGATDDI